MNKHYYDDMKIVGVADEYNNRHNDFLMSVFKSNLNDYVNEYGYLNMKNGNYIACYCDDEMSLPYVVSFCFTVKDDIIELVKCVVDNEDSLRSYTAQFYFPNIASAEESEWSDAEYEVVDSYLQDHYEDDDFTDYIASTIEQFYGEDYQVLAFD